MWLLSTGDTVQARWTSPSPVSLADMSDTMSPTRHRWTEDKVCTQGPVLPPPAERKGTEVSCRPTWNLVNHEHGDAQLCSLQTDKAQLRQGSWGFQIRDLQNSSELWYPVKDCFHGILRFLQTSPRVGLLMTCQWNYTWGSFATETKGCESENSG